MTAPTIWVGTRKGLFAVRKGPSGWKPAAPKFAGEPVSQFARDAQTGACYAALRLGHFGVKFWKSEDGAQWTEAAAPAFPPKPAEGEWAQDETAWTVDMVWALEADGGTLWAGCTPAGLFKSTDGGATWQLVETLWLREERKEWMGGGYDLPGIHSICVDPRNAQHVTIAISCGGIWQTRDGGSTWANTSKGMVADYMPPERKEDGNIQDVHRLVQCAAQPDVLWAQNHFGIYRSTDAGALWTRIEAPQPSDFGFAVAVHPKDAKTAWFAPAHSDQNRVPVDGRMVSTRTRDGGASFEASGDGLPSNDAYHLVYRHGLSVSADGGTLAMGSTTGGLWVSEDGGAAWTCVSRDLPPISVVRVD
jgi:photosystem II stability/assembly factor-like uncharacterized protein